MMHILCAVYTPAVRGSIKYNIYNYDVYLII